MSAQQRRENMSQIRSINTKPEAIVRKYLFSKGFRYRKNDRRYPGKPDIVLPKYHILIYVNGCFWHQHAGCRYAAVPKSNQEYWLPKLARNIARDKEVYKEAVQSGWNVIVVWECAVKNKNRETALKTLVDSILSASSTASIREIAIMQEENDVY